jgi:hypothetical protein
MLFKYVGAAEKFTNFQVLYGILYYCAKAILGIASPTPFPSNPEFSVPKLYSLLFDLQNFFMLNDLLKFEKNVFCSNLDIYCSKFDASFQIFV